METKNGNRMAVIALLSICCAIVLFVVLTIIQQTILKNVPESLVAVAVQDIPKGVTLTRENIGSYVSLEKRITEHIPEDCCYNLEEILGRVTRRTIRQREYIVGGVLTKEDLYVDTEDSVVLSIHVSKIGQAVAGTLRSGDTVAIRSIIDVSLLGANEASELMELEDTESPFQVYVSSKELPKEEPEETGDVWSVTGKLQSHMVCESAKIVGAYNAAGVEVSSYKEGTVGDTVATVINIVIPRQDMDAVMLAQEEGTIYFAKLLEE